MFKKSFKTKMGFSMVEMLVVIAVIGILAAIAIPAFIGVDEKVDFDNDENTLVTINNAIDSQTALTKKEITSVSELRSLLKKNGFADETLIPETVGCGFVWDKSEDIVLMVSLKDNLDLTKSRVENPRYMMDGIILPKNCDDIVNDGDWYFIHEAPTAENNEGLYPSAAGIARARFSTELEKKADPSDPDSKYLHDESKMFVTAVQEIRFNYGKDDEGNPIEYVRPAEMAYAFFDINGKYDNGIEGRKLDTVYTCAKLRLDTFDGTGSVSSASELWAITKTDVQKQIAPGTYFHFSYGIFNEGTDKIYTIGVIEDDFTAAGNAVTTEEILPVDFVD